MIPAFLSPQEIVVLGILRVVEEIRLRKPDAKIVINSLLPMVDYLGFQQPKMSDFADFRRKRENAMRESLEVKNAKDRFAAAKAAKEVAAARGTKGAGDRRRRMQENTGPRQNMKGRSLEPAKKRDMRGKQKEVAKKETKRQARKRQKEEKKGKRMEGGKEWKRKKRGESEDDATKGPALAKAMEKKEKKLNKKDKKIVKRVFKDNEKYHPKKPVAKVVPFIKKRVLPPVWPSVHLINAKLKEFCSKHDSITFFDATSIFATNEGPGGHRLKNELISPRGHPSAYGFAVWEGNIMGRLQQLLHERPAPKPEAAAENDSDSEEEPSAGEDSDSEMSGEGDSGGEVSAEEDSGGEDADEAPAEEGGNGQDHVSEGKEAEVPQATEQPSRSAPSKSEDSSDDKKSSGKEDSKKKPSGKEDSKTKPAGKEDSEEKPAGKEDSEKKPAVREDSERKPTGTKNSGKKLSENKAS